MEFDRTRAKSDLALLADESRALKKVLGATWTRPMKDEQQRLVRVKRRATELCVLLAFARGRFHVRTQDAEWHSKIAARIANDYVLAVAS